MTTSESFHFQHSSHSSIYGTNENIADPFSVPSTLKSWRNGLCSGINTSDLAPLSSLLDEESPAVLQRELQKVHQLLVQQQAEIRSLLEQAENREIQLQQTQQETEALHQSCDRQAAQMKEMESICRDLKTQLKRQQQRVLQYRTLLNQAQEQPLFVAAESSRPCRESQVDFSKSAFVNRNATDTKIQIDEEWVLQKTQSLMGPAVAQRKLLTLGLSTSTIMHDDATETTELSLTKLYEKITVAPLTSAAPSEEIVPARFEVDLPCFAKSKLA